MTSDETSPPPASIGLVGREFAVVNLPIVAAQGLVFSTRPADPTRLLASRNAVLSMNAFWYSPVFLFRTCRLGL